MGEKLPAGHGKHAEDAAAPLDAENVPAPQGFRNDGGGRDGWIDRNARMHGGARRLERYLGAKILASCSER